MARERRYASQSDLAREVERLKLSEFSFEKDGVIVYMNAKSIAEYVSFCVAIGLLGADLAPYVETNEITRQGFEWSLANKIENFALQMGFSDQEVRAAIKSLVTRSPPRVPAPRAVHALIKPKCDYPTFYKAVTVTSYQARVTSHLRMRAVFLADDIFSERDDA